MFPSIESSLTNLAVYSTPEKILITGFDCRDASYRLLEIDRPEEESVEELTIKQDYQIRKRVDLDAYIKTLSEATVVETGIVFIHDNNTLSHITSHLISPSTSFSFILLSCSKF